VLKPGAKLAYVVGDQASYLRVMIRTGQILAEIAEREGYQVERIDLFRTRFATATQNELREEVVVLRWPGTTATQSGIVHDVYQHPGSRLPHTRRGINYEKL